MLLISCYIIGNDGHSNTDILSYVEKTPGVQIIGYSDNPFAAVSHFQKTGKYPDLTFIDIDMPDISGIELSSLLADKTAIVFITGQTKYAIDAFEMDVSDYLLKPFTYERFLKCVLKINDRIFQKRNNVKEPADNFYYIQTGNKGHLIKIFLKDILYVESQKNYVAIATSEGKYLTYLTLTEIEEKLVSCFLRINKSYIINVHKISHVEGNEVFLMNVKEGFLIGASYKDAFSSHMKTYLLKSKRIHE